MKWRLRTEKKYLSKPDLVNQPGINRRKVLTALGATSLAVINSPVNSLAETSGGKKKSEVRIYDTVATMRSDIDLKAGETIATMGYYLPGDGGGTTYKVIEQKDGLKPDEGSVIKISNNRYALLYNTSHVNYKMFGAKGDTNYDDGIAIKRAHAFANKEKIPVINLSGEYWIKDTYNINILTNVSWGHSIFHIDEHFNLQNSYHFRIKSCLNPYSLELNASEKKNLLQQVKPGVQFIPELAPYKNALVFISDKKDKIGYRAGSKYKGQEHSKEEFFYMEEGGRLIGEVAWTFSDYTTLMVYPCDSNYLIIDGGTFYLSGNNPGETYNGYWKNGFSITRSRTIIRNQWVGLEKGKEDVALTPRSGFYTFSRTYDITLENVRLIPWIQDRAGKEKDVPAGTYGLSCNRTLQSRFFNVTAEGGKGYWGVFGTNLNKNFIIDQCILNRVDVHFHCWNLHIKNSSIGYKGITVTGGGNLIVENTTVRSRHYFLSFRRDFGSTWDGDIYINNCRHIPASKGEKVILRFNTANFDYHYPIVFGHVIRVDNLIVDCKNDPDPESTCWLMKMPAFSEMGNGERLHFPCQITFKNITVKGRKKGIRLLRVEAPQSYKLPTPGGYDDDMLHTNSRVIFDNIQLEQIESQKESSITDVHLFINKKPKERYTDKFALYPDIQIRNCNDLTASVSGAANLNINHCSIQQLNVGSEKPLQGSLKLNDCKLTPVMNDEHQISFNLSSESGTSFTNCMFLSPQVNGIPRPDLFNKSGIIEINKSVKYNHLNSKIGNTIFKYYKSKGLSFNDKFINMLKVHSDMESVHV